MNKVLKLQRVGLITPTVVEYEGKVLATNHLDIESLCNLWRVHFGFYTTEKVDLAMTKKQFSSIQQKTLSSVKSVYELFYERNFIPREFEANEEHTEWGMYRNKELEKLEAENAAMRERLEKAVELPLECNSTVWYLNTQKSISLNENTIYEGILERYHLAPIDGKVYFVADIRIKNDYGVTVLPEVEKDYGKTWFSSYETALARLAELKGGKE